VNALFGLTLRQILGGMRVWLLLLFLGLPVLLLAIVLSAGGFRFVHDPEVTLGIYYFLLYPQALCILAALLYGSSLLAAEIEGKTLVYLFTRRVSRTHVLVQKYLATVAALITLTGASLTVCFALGGFPGGMRMYLTLLATIAAAVFAYTAIFSLLGLLVPRRAIPAGLIYTALVEVILGTVPVLANELSVSHYLRSFALHLSGRKLPPDVLEFFNPPSLGEASVALAVFPLLFLAICAVVVRWREWPLTEGV
jgi:ABC-type transport system involved in multi-copper enzyme maturation permease subunit